MVTLEFYNYVLSLIGEQPMLSSDGDLGSLLANSVYSSTLAIVQSSRATFFERMFTATATNNDYLVPAFSLPNELVQLYSMWLVTPQSDLIEMHRQPLQSLTYGNHYFSYDIIGNDVYFSRNVVRPTDVKLRGLFVPNTKIADDVVSPIPQPAIPAVAHGAASIMCLSYVDDANAAASHKKISDELTLLLRQQYGASRGRNFNLNPSVGGAFV